MPCRLLSMNDRQHWRARSQLIRCWRTTTMEHTLQQLAGISRDDAAVAAYRLYHLRRPLPADLVVSLPPVIVAPTYPVPDRRERDPHNYYPTTKACVDGIADVASWPSDGPDWVTTLEPRLAVKAPAVVITLIERPPS